MYQLEWSKPPPGAGALPVAASRVDATTIERVYALEWQEHCVECAAPQCYTSCVLYVRRGDGACARFKHGIYPNPAMSGLFPFAADVSFRRWGKLEANLFNGVIAVQTARRLQAVHGAITRILTAGSYLHSWIYKDRFMLRWYAGLRRRLYAWMTAPSKTPALKPEEFLLEMHSFEAKAFRLNLELFHDKTLFRTALPVQPGANIFRIPASEFGSEFGTELETRGAKIYLYPENDAEVRVAFTWLDFVAYRTGAARPVETRRSAAVATSAAKVKCVVWDLDNTLWDGILADVGENGVKLRAEALELVRALDERGILQSVSSKNNPEPCLKVLEKMGLADYFLYPSINWGPKSQAFTAIAGALNIGIDSLAFIDDSEIERAEVSDAHPAVRCYDASEVSRLLARLEFDVPVSAESRKRRASYLTEASRARVATEFQGDHEQFLRSCKLVARLCPLNSETLFTRCLELLERSNQLNLTTRRYKEPELRALLADPKMLCVAIQCSDRFGDYGTVGFLCVDLSGKTALLRDFVMSCRVAKKKVENAVWQWLTQRLQTTGYANLDAHFFPTERNAVILEALLEAGFAERDSIPGGKSLRISCGQKIPSADVVAVEAEAIAGVMPA